MKAITARADEREQMLYVLLGATGMRIGEALGIEIDKHFSDHLSTLLIYLMSPFTSFSSSSYQETPTEVHHPQGEDFPCPRELEFG